MFTLLGVATRDGDRGPLLTLKQVTLFFEALGELILIGGVALSACLAVRSLHRQHCSRCTDAGKRSILRSRLRRQRLAATSDPVSGYFETADAGACARNWRRSCLIWRPLRPEGVLARFEQAWLSGEAVRSRPPMCADVGSGRYSVGYSVCKLERLTLPAPMTRAMRLGSTT